MILSFLFIIGGSPKLSGQDSSEITQNLKRHIEYLSSDDLEGRMTGSLGEQLAYDYIIKEFRAIGLKALEGAGGQGYLQIFEFTYKRYADPSTTLKTGSKTWLLNEDFYPLSISGNGTIKARAVFLRYGIDAPELNYSDYDGLKNLERKIFIIEISSPDGIHPHSKYLDYNELPKRVETAIEKGASGIIFINSDSTAEDPLNKLSDKTRSMGLPVVFWKKADLKEFDLLKQKIQIRTLVKTEKRSGHNVMGYIDNGSETTVVIGAHYDHLGYGEKGSLYTGEPAIHNGADDNASGTALMIELARSLQNGTAIGNNYLFIAFSGEELGLYGSNYFVKNPLLDLESINYMINMDMVGRMEKDKGVMINGVGTSPEFDDIKHFGKSHPFRIVSSESGIGPSDHTSFYLKDIPVLHFFTGPHEDYHKPSDDANKINYGGIYQLHFFILEMIEMYNRAEMLEFTKTKESPSEKVPKFSVTLGVVPDYMFDGEGMRIDGIREGKPAYNAGLKEGDIVIRFGSFPVMDMMSYMKGLSHYKKGDKTTVAVIREDEELTFEVQF